MAKLSYEIIRNDIADSSRVFYRGERIYENGELLCVETDKKEFYTFRYDGNYGVYTISVDLADSAMPFLCDCPYPGDGCKHIVASLLTVLDMRYHPAEVAILPDGQFDDEVPPVHLTYEGIKAQALEDRSKRAKTETFKVIQGDMYKDEHLLHGFG